MGNRNKWITWQEAAFFGIYFLVFPLFSELQYRSDYQDGSAFFPTFDYFTFSGLLNIIPYFLFYKFIIPRYLFRKRYAAFVIASLLWMVAFDLYIRFAIDWTLGQLAFLPAEVKKTAKNAFNFSRVIRQGVSFTWMNLLGVTALAFFVRTLQKERQLAHLQQQQLQLELKALKAQLQPHFFFNTLNNIYSMALQGSAATAPVVKMLADMMRYILEETDRSRVELEAEVAFIGNYIELERIRHDDNIRISFDFQGEAKGVVIEPFLLLPLIENAFKHGVDHETGTGFVEIVIVLEAKELALQINNSKPVRIPIADGQRNGVGLANLHKRLSLLYPDRHRIRVKETLQSYEVFLNIGLC
jgi:sensor histidine kinase YesM